MEPKEGLKLARELINQGLSYDEALKTLEEKASGASLNDRKIWVYSQVDRPTKAKFKVLNFLFIICCAVYAVLEIGFGVSSGLPIIPFVVHSNKVFGLLALWCAFEAYRWRRDGYAIALLMAGMAGTRVPFGEDLDSLTLAVRIAGFVLLWASAAIGIFAVLKFFPKLSWRYEPKD